MELILEIYVARHCFGTPEALRLAGEVKDRMPHFRLDVRVIDDMPAADTNFVFATPSYFLDGHLLFLGNPRFEDLVARIASLSPNKGGNYE